MLVIDPSKRASMEQLMSDKWYTEGCESEPAQIISPSQTPVLSPEQHKAVMDELDELGLDREAVLKSIHEGLYDSLTATYYLVADRKANGLPNPFKSSSSGSPLKGNHAKKNTSKATDLEILDEDEDCEKAQKERKPKEEGGKKSEATKQETQSATSAAPPRVVSGRRRAATVTDPKPKEIPAEGGDATTRSIIPSIPAKKAPSPDFITSTTAQTESKAPAMPEQPPTLPPIQSRGRSHTIAPGKAHGNEEEEQVVSIEQFRSHLKDGEPRTARFTFSVSTTSTKDPPQVFDLVKKALTEAQVKFSTLGMVATCQLNDLEFEIEVCKLPNLQVVGLRCKRLGGDVWAYKDALSSLIATMNL